MRCKFKAVLGLIENNSPKIMSAETSADATKSDVLDPRTVFCTRGGLFTGLRVRDALEPNPAGSSVGLDICCTTSVYVEGLGDFGDSCVQLGNVTVEEPADVVWGKGELCNGTSVVSDVVVENAGAGSAAYISSLFVYCVDRTTDYDSVVDHLSVAFSATGIDHIGTFRRTVPPAPIPITLTAALNIAAATEKSVRVRPIETFESCSVAVAGEGGQGDGSNATDNEWVFFAADLQCQGVRHDRCTCVAGSVQCVFGTPTGPLVARDMVMEGDLLHMKDGGTPGWCEDGDPVHRWMLITDTTSGDCKALPPGQSNLITLPCDSAVAAQRWKPAAYQGELAAGAMLQDSRLESASNPGTCVMLQNTTTGGLQPVVGSCFAADLLSAIANVPSEGGDIAGTEGAVYAAPLALVPLRSATGDWYSDHSTISEAFAVLGSPLTETFASMEAAAALANTAGFAGRSRHEMPHCVKHGIICNAMGRVVYYSAQGATNVTADAPAVKIPGVDNVVLDLLQLPWLVDIHLEGSAVEGRLPDLQELVSLPAMLRSANFANTTTSGSLPTGLEELPLLAQLNMSNTLISGPLPAGLLMPPMAPATHITPDSMMPSSFLTLDVTGVPVGDTPLCAPYNLTMTDRPSRMRIINGGEPYDVPVCEQYVEWSITLSTDAACAMADVCSPEHQKPYAAHVELQDDAELDYADTPTSSAPSAAPTLRQRSESASEPGQAVAELECAATCAADAPAESSADALLEAVTVNVIMTPAAPEDVIAARSHATPDEEDVTALAPASTAPVLAPVAPPLVATGATRRLAGVHEIASMLGNRRLLLPALVDMPPHEYRRHVGSLTALRGATRRLQQTSGDDGKAPVVKFVTVGLAPSQEAGTALLTTMFSDMLTSDNISAATIAWQGGEEAVADATAEATAAAAAAGAGASTPGAPGVQDSGVVDGTDVTGANAAGAGQTGSVTSADVPQEKESNNSIPRKALIVVFTLVAILLVVLLVLGCWRWRVGRDNPAIGDGKSSYLSAGVPMMDEGSIASDYSRITPTSNEYTHVPNLGSVSMSVNGMKERGEGCEHPNGAGTNSRRPLWMQVDTSGSIRSMLQSRGRSKSHQNSDSGAATNSDALHSRSFVPGRSKYMADFPKGSPAKGLLANQDVSTAADKLPPVSGSWNCESELEPNGTFSLISASVDAKERDAMTELTAPSSLRSSLQTTTAGNEDDQHQLANGTSGQLTCKSSLQTFSVRRSAENMLEATGDEEIDSICVGLPGYDSMPLTAAKRSRSGAGSGGVLGSLTRSTREIINSSLGLNATYYTMAHSTANGTSAATGTNWYDAASHAGTSGRTLGGGSQTPPAANSSRTNTRSPALESAAGDHGQAHIVNMNVSTPPVLTAKDDAAPANGCSSEEEGDGDAEAAMFNSTTTPPEGGYVRSLVRNLPWRSPHTADPERCSSEAILTPNSCPLQVSPSPAENAPALSGDVSDVRKAGAAGASASAPFSTMPTGTSFPVATDEDNTGTFQVVAPRGMQPSPQAGACNKVTSWLQNAPSACNALTSVMASTVPSSPDAASIEAGEIPWMPSNTTHQSQAAGKVTEYTQEQEEEDRSKQLASKSKPLPSTAPPPTHCLESEIHITSLSLPSGSVFKTEERGPVILDSATGQPCTVMAVCDAETQATTARVIVCTYAEQCAAIEQRAEVCDVCPPILPLQVPAGLADAGSSASGSSTLRAAPAVYFACTDTLAEEIESGTSRSSPEAAGLLLASLCALLERLHIAGYTAGGLTPDIVVRPTRCGRPSDWKLLCAHSVLQQGSTAEPVAPLNIRWCAPEQVMFARSAAHTGGISTGHQSGSVGDKGDRHASKIRPPAMATADVASDMFSLGLILYKAVTGCDYWGDFTDEQVAEALAGEIPMPHLCSGPAHEHPAATVVLPLICPLLTRSAPARPLASETLAAVHERFPNVLRQVVLRTSIPRSPLDHIRYPDAKPPVRPTANTQPVTMRFMLAQRGEGGQVLRTVPAQRLNHKWVFPVVRGAQYHMVVCIELADNTPVAVFPMDNASHVVAEASNASAPTGTQSQTLEIQSADAYYAGRGVLLLVPWDPSELLQDAKLQEMRMHLFTKVVGFSELIKISKRVHINVTDESTPLASAEEGGEGLQVPLDVVQFAREGGIHFEAHIPLSKQALEGR